MSQPSGFSASNIAQKLSLKKMQADIMENSLQYQYFFFKFKQDLVVEFGELTFFIVISETSSHSLVNIFTIPTLYLQLGVASVKLAAFRKVNK